MIGAIIQARMTSSRLPGKVLLEIDGRPVLDYLYERIGRCSRLQTIILATTTNKEDNPLVDYARKHGLQYFRGSEQDVLARYYLAAQQYGIDHIMRITADCPLIEPKICDDVIGKYLDEKADYVYLDPAFAEGVDCEIFSFRALEQAYNNAKMMSEREHVVRYFHNHPDIFKIVTLKNQTDDSKYRFTVDEPEDFKVISNIIMALQTKDKKVLFGVEEIKRYLAENPDVFNLNSQIIRNEGLLISLRKDREVDAQKQ